jgi:hypothetical protein
MDWVAVMTLYDLKTKEVDLESTLDYIEEKYEKVD